MVNNIVSSCVFFLLSVAIHIKLTFFYILLFSPHFCFNNVSFTMCKYVCHMCVHFASPQWDSLQKLLVFFCSTWSSSSTSFFWINNNNKSNILQNCFHTFSQPIITRTNTMFTSHTHFKFLLNFYKNEKLLEFCVSYYYLGCICTLLMSLENWFGVKRRKSWKEAEKRS